MIKIAKAEDVGAVVGGLVGAVDYLMYFHHRQLGDEVATAEGVDPNDERVVRGLAELAVDSTNSHVVGPAGDLLRDSSEERRERLVRAILRSLETPPPRPSLRLVP